MSRSQKTAIIEALFNERYDPETGRLSDPVVSVADLRKYKPEGNLYAFFKDIVRNTVRGNAIWPKSVLQRGFTGIQDVSRGGNSFRFIPLPPGQDVAFVSADTLAPRKDTPRQRVESTSLPLASRQLGRGDEPWLIQVAVRLRLIETHLALFSPHVVLNIDHLQMSVKLGKSEIDALFLGVEIVDADTTGEFIVCCEAKGMHDDIIEEQWIRQVQAIARQPVVTQQRIMPIAIKAIGKSEIFVLEFDIVERATVDTLDELTPISDAIYVLIPPVPGIGE